MDVASIDTITVVKLGSEVFQIIKVVVTSLLAVVFVVEAVRTRFWHNLPSFDFVDLTRARPG